MTTESILRREKSLEQRVKGLEIMVSSHESHLGDLKADIETVMKGSQKNRKELSELRKVVLLLLEHEHGYNGKLVRPFESSLPMRQE